MSDPIVTRRLAEDATFRAEHVEGDVIGRVEVSLFVSKRAGTEIESEDLACREMASQLRVLADVLTERP